MTSSKQKGGATRNSKGGQPHTVLMEHYTQHVLQQGNTSTSPSASGTSQVIVHQQSQSLSSDATLPMINVLRPAKTKLGKARQRMKWTTEVNEYILRTYYLITSLETNCKHYRDTLHRLFNEEFPDVEVCAQRIADQRRAIVKNHLLTQERIDEIRREVELDLQAGGVIHQPQQQLQPVASSCSTVVTSNNNNGGGLVVSSPVMAMSKGTPHLTHGSPTMTVWYGCVKEEEPDNSTTDGYHVGSHKLRKLNQGEGVPGGGGGQSQEQHQHQQPQHIIIHTTSGGTITTTTTDALRR